MLYPNPPFPSMIFRLLLLCTFPTPYFHHHIPYLVISIHHFFLLPVPFEDDPKNPQTWYFDHTYHETMFAMYKKVNASEKVVGWYSTGPLIRPSDIEIHEVIRRYCPQPVFVIVDVKPKEDTEVPTKAYYSIPATPEVGSMARREFVHVPSGIEAEEAEEVGVEHLLREIKEIRVSSLTDIVGSKLAALRALDKRMHEIYEYLDNVCKGVLPINNKILSNIQDISSYCADMKRAELARAFAIKSHDSLIAIYMASLVRSISGLHDLISNKLMNRAAEKGEEEKRALISATRNIGDEPDEQDINLDNVEQEPEF